MKSYKLFLIVALTLISSSLLAADVGCKGKVSHVAVASGGDVRLITDFRKSYFTICNTNGTWNNIPTTTCIAWFSQAMQAYKNQSDLLVKYPADTNCNTFPDSGNSPIPYWVISN